MSDGILSSIGSWFAPDIYGPISQGLQTGYNLAQPELAQALSTTQQAYGQAIPYAQQNLTQPLSYYNPIYGAGMNAINAVQGATGTGGGAPGSFWNQFTNTPTYQFPLNQAIQQTQRAAAASGGTPNTGATNAAIANLSSNYASQQYQNYINNLYQQTPWATLGAAGASGAYNMLGTQIPNLMTGGAAAQTGILGSLANLGWGYGTGLGAAGAQQNVANANYGLGALTGLGSFFGNLLGGSGSGLSALGSGLAGIFSDVRLKEDVEPVGKLYDGSNVYKFRYKGDPISRLGLMAQEVERRTPDAVREHPSGFKMVDYEKATRPASALAMLMAA